MRKAIIVLVLVVLAGCGGKASQETATPDTTEAAPTTSVDMSTDTTEDPGATETTEGSSELAVNQTATYEDGVKMTVLGLNRNGRKTQYASGGGPGDQIVVVTVKVSNTSSKPIDLSVTLNLAYGKDGNSAESVYDEGIDGISQPAKLQPGRSATGRYGFAVPKGRAKNLSFSGQPGFDYNETTWIAA